ncbi:hypothetical protein TYRP_019465 [Tyrophagus putrescentiae]|nr:hypothetical protein TYRP_019465 [Tyrophagus putrescentiae]
MTVSEEQGSRMVCGGVPLVSSLASPDTVPAMSEPTFGHKIEDGAHSFSFPLLFVVITKKRIKLPHVSNAHCPYSSALYSSDPDIKSAVLFLHKQASNLTLCALPAAFLKH